jgi:molybdate-binding protein
VIVSVVAILIGLGMFFLRHFHYDFLVSKEVTDQVAEVVEKRHSRVE